MAHKRMFSRDITASDAFRDLPSSSQALYFHLGMEADDDGFIGNPKSIQRSLGASEDDIKLLIAKRFILVCDDGVIVIKHWLLNNTIRRDRYIPTKYTEQKSRLFLKKNKAYSDNEASGKPFGNQLATIGMHRIGEERIEENRIDIASQGGKDLTKEQLEQNNARIRKLIKSKTL